MKIIDWINKNNDLKNNLILQNNVLEEVPNKVKNIVSDNYTYHATNFPIEDFINWIDPKIAKWFWQWYWFYLHKDKARWLQHMRDLESNSIIKENKSKIPWKTILIVLDEKINNENFDIDYEQCWSSVAWFILQNEDYFENKKSKYNIKNIHKKYWTVSFKREDNSRFSIWSFRIDWKLNTLSIQNAWFIAKIMEGLKQNDPNMFNKFENFAFQYADTIKYNWKEKNIPLRIEDIEWNILWKRLQK